MGKAEESTTRRPETPYTLALLSSTAIGSDDSPIAPENVSFLQQRKVDVRTYKCKQRGKQWRKSP